VAFLTAPAASAGRPGTTRAAPGISRHWKNAIKWRRARVGLPCGGCQNAPDSKCEDHGRDVGLIANYEQAARQLLTAP
jgi:hypothetical protein